MNRNRKILVALLACLLGLGLAPVKAESAFTAGAASVDITPDLSSARVVMAGYSARLGRPAQGVHDPVRCRALTVSDDNQNAAIISCDLVSISTALRQKVVDKLSGSPYHDANVMIAATHTHSGPGGYDKNFVFQAAGFGVYNDRLVDEMADKIVSAVDRAHSSMQPAKISVARTELEDLSRNRRYGKGYNYMTRRSEDSSDQTAPVDPALTVIRFDDVDGGPIAIVFHFATHATILGPDNMQISAEWPGVAMQKIERALPGATAIFLNGPEGDQTPIVTADGANDYAWVERIGNRIGDAVLETMDTTSPIEGAPVRAAITRRPVQGPGRILGVPLSPRTARALFPAMPLQVIRIGECALLAVPLEMTATPGMALKSAAKSHAIKAPLVIGLANDFYWYCVGPDEFKTGSPYEPGNTIYGRIEAGLVIGEELMLLEWLVRPEKGKE